MLNKRIISLAPLLLATAVAGCGSSSSSSSERAASSAASNGTSQPVSSGSSSSGASRYSSGGGASQSSATAAPAALITTKHAKLGTILAYGNKQLTVYMFDADHGAASNCAGACARVWPPVTGTPKATAGAASADLGTIKRADGRLQVTYKGHPLYLFKKDGDGGDAYGQGIHSFGAGWYVLKPTGQKIDES